jgi:fucose permease
MVSQMNKNSLLYYAPIISGVYLIMFLAGSFGSSRGALLHKILDFYSLSYSEGGLMFLLFIIPGMIGSLSAGYLFHKFNKKRVMLFGVSVIVVSSFGIPLSPTYWLYLLFTVVFSYGLSVSVTVGNIAAGEILETVLPNLKENGINLIHFTFAIGSLIPLLLFTFYIHKLVSWQLPFIIISIFFTFVFICYLFFSYPEKKENRELPGLEEYKKALKNPQLQKYILLVVLYTGAEGGIVNWAPTFFHDAINMSERSASNILLAFFIFFTVGRFLGTMLIHSFNKVKLFLFLSTMLTISLFLSLVLKIRPFGVEVFVPLSGLFFAPIFPIFQVKLIDDFNSMVGVATSILFTSATFGITLLPFFIGIANDIIGVKYGIILNLVSVVGMIPVFYYIEKYRK